MAASLLKTFLQNYLYTTFVPTGLSAQSVILVVCVSPPPKITPLDQWYSGFLWSGNRGRSIDHPHRVVLGNAIFQPVAHVLLQDHVVDEATETPRHIPGGEDRKRFSYAVVGMARRRVYVT
jgi:hypothetical protein